MHPIAKVGVVGAGTMGHGIAQVAAAAGYDVVLVDAAKAALDRGLGNIAKGYERLVAKDKMAAQDRDAALSRLRGEGDVAALGEVDLAIEAVVERLEVKLKVLGDLDGICHEGAILATNTSSISITRLAAATKRPAKVIGMHFMNPVPLMQLVELIRAIQTSDAAYAQTRALAEKMGKTTVVAKDMPGFIVNRILIPMLNEACFALQEGLGTVEDIDTAMKLGTNQPMGPLTLADFIGLDTVLAIANVLHEGLGESKYRPSPLLRQYVDAGWLGRKAGRGFYKY